MIKVLLLEQFIEQVIKYLPMYIKRGEHIVGKNMSAFAFVDNLQNISQISVE
jgi:hypothetical protein